MHVIASNSRKIIILKQISNQSQSYLSAQNSQVVFTEESSIPEVINSVKVVFETLRRGWKITETDPLNKHRTKPFFGIFPRGSGLSFFEFLRRSFVFSISTSHNILILLFQSTCIWKLPGIKYLLFRKRTSAGFLQR